jgi:hypothetical protein
MPDEIEGAANESVMDQSAPEPDSDPDPESEQVDGEQHE